MEPYHIIRLSPRAGVAKGIIALLVQHSCLVMCSMKLAFSANTWEQLTECKQPDAEHQPGQDSQLAGGMMGFACEQHMGRCTSS